MLKRALYTLTFCVLGLMASGCTSTDTIDPQPVPSTIPLTVNQFTSPILDPTNGIIPLPNALLTASPGNGGQNAFPGAGEPFTAMNSITGFSTTGNLLIPFNGPVDPATVNANTVPVYNEATNARAAMNYQVVNAANGNSTIVASPIVPLRPSSNYVCLITSGVQRPGNNAPVISDNTINFSKVRTRLIDANGNSTQPLLSNAIAAQLEPLRFAMQGTWAQAEGASGIQRENIPLAFRFGTQALNVDLPNFRTNIVARNMPLVPGAPPLTPAVWHAAIPNATLQATLAPVLPGLNAAGTRVVIGNVSGTNFRPLPALTSIFQAPFNTNQPLARNIPFVAFLPNAVAFPGPRPTVIFQHGITGAKELAAIPAAAFNAQGIAVIAIDLELHGQLTEGANSGDGFINPANLRASRDHIRQSVCNLYTLNQAIFGAAGGANIDGVAGGDLAPVPPFFLGHSLGGIVGTIFTATETNLGRSVVNVAGGRITNIVTTSPSISPAVLAGLAAADPNLVPGTPQFAQFFLIAQTVLDDADPLNYAQAASAKTGTSTILFQNNTADNVVPPATQQDLMRAFGQTPAFSQVDAVTSLAPFVAQAASGFVGAGGFEIINAGHGILLNPADTTLPNTQADIFAQIGAFYQTGAINAGNVRIRAVLGNQPEDTTDYGSVVGFY